MNKTETEEKFSLCPHCGTETTLEDPNFCIECGACLVNYCTNDNCPLNNADQYEEVFCLPRDAKYCYECGSKSTFYDSLVNKENK